MWNICKETNNLTECLKEMGSHGNVFLEKGFTTF